MRPSVRSDIGDELTALQFGCFTFRVAHFDHRQSGLGRLSAQQERRRWRAGRKTGTQLVPRGSGGREKVVGQCSWYLRSG
jgi:hypothetical protein